MFITDERLALEGLRVTFFFAGSNLFSDHFPGSKQFVIFFLDGWDAGTIELIMHLLPVTIVVIDEAPIEESMTLVSTEVDKQALFPQFATGADVLEMGDIIPEDGIAIVRQAQSLRKSLLDQLPGTLIHVGGGGLDPASRFGILVVIDHQAAFVTEAVGVGEDILVDSAHWG